ncbi:MAG: protein phosphatase 2C domain-containing protein [Acidobacteria bacterium]|nr:protein phosphatase 2C domain-containing protein [Acidobacteriota bacterium]
MEITSEIISAAVSDRGLSDKRPVNEDSYISLDQANLYAVADGVGGAQAGDVASQMAVEILGEAFAHYGDTVDPEEIMKVAIERANEAIFQMASELPQLSSMATTIAAIHLSTNIATIAHVGDSRVYRLDPQGHLHRETDDHSMVEEEVRAGRMTPEQALTHPSRNIISRAVGAADTVEVDIKTILIDPGSVYLLCSDGITRHISDNELEHLLATGMSPEMLCEQMKDLCYERGAEDNLTAIIIKTVGTEYDDSPRPEPDNFIADVLEEDETVATARTIATTEADVPEAITETAVTEDTADDEWLTQETTVAEAVAETSYEPAVEESLPQEYTSQSVVVPAVQPAGQDRDLEMFGNKVRAVEPAPKISSGTVVGTILSSLIWLILGGLLGISGYYLWHKNNPIEPEPAPPVLVEKTSDIQRNAFSEGLKLVDADPAGYLKARAADPKDAVDHYLLGRAQLLSGDAFAAGHQFRLAKDKLSETNHNDAERLAAEIAAGTAITQNPVIFEVFKKEYTALKDAVAADKTENSNSAANTAQNANTANGQ